MERNRWRWIGLACLLATALLLLLLSACTWGANEPASAPVDPPRSEAPSSGANPQPPAKPEAPAAPETPESIDTVWGIDTASIVDRQFFACVKENFGFPAFVGRYLETKEGVSYGITKEEAAFLHEQGVKILPIYNHFTDATTYEGGVAEAKQAIRLAGEAGIPEGVAIFADVEPDYPVDAEFLRGWTATMLESSYVPGLYAVLVEASDSKALSSYLRFAQEHQELASELAVWTSDVEVGITTKANAPQAYAPEAEAVTTVDVWQYGIDAEACNIDTNLMRSSFVDYLW